ncbi:MAG: hypothetical protein QXL94_09215 [Candidatus Parvarchaeum sp.]
MNKERVINNAVLSAMGAITTITYLAVHQTAPIVGYVMLGFYSAYGVHAISANYKAGQASVTSEAPK